MERGDLRSHGPSVEMANCSGSKDMILGRDGESERITYSLKRSSSRFILDRINRMYEMDRSSKGSRKDAKKSRRQENHGFRLNKNKILKIPFILSKFLFPF